MGGYDNCRSYTDIHLYQPSQVDVASVLNLCLIPKPHVAGLGMRFVSLLFGLYSYLCDLVNMYVVPIVSKGC